MPNQRKKAKVRVDFWLDDEERRVLKELLELTDAHSATEVCRYMLEQAALANGITPPRKIISSASFARAPNLTYSAGAVPAKNKGNKNK